MENYVDKLLKLEDSYGHPVKKTVLDGLFGKEVISKYVKSQKKYVLNRGYIGREGFVVKRKSEKISKNKLERARKYSKFFKLIPWIKFAAVTGDVAFGSATEGSDIDIFLVVKDNRLWITRGLELVLFNLIGIRRVTWKKDTKNKLCINYSTSDKNLNLKPKKGNEFLVGLEISMMKPVYNEDYYKNILKHNEWLLKYYPNRKGTYTKSENLFGGSLLFDALDDLAMKLQIIFMKKMGHSTKDSTIERDRITFFDEDTKWQERVKRL